MLWFPPRFWVTTQPVIIVIRRWYTLSTSASSKHADIHFPSQFESRSRCLTSTGVTSRERYQRCRRSFVHGKVATFFSSGSSGESDERSTEEATTRFEVINGKGVITLNRPRALNALNFDMIASLREKLKEWEASNSGVQFVIIRGAGGKAFCAGGDIRAVTTSAKSRTPLYKDFFREEFHLNYLIGTLAIPYIALIDGITLGGGAGLCVHGPYRVATERTLFAMPETSIGLFPDVGTSHFLPGLRGKLGMYLALTGDKLKGGDVFRAGVATHMCDSTMLPALEQDLISLSDPTPHDIDKVLSKYHDQSPDARKPFTLKNNEDVIDKSFDAKSVEEIIHNLKTDGSEWALKTAKVMSRLSPTSMKITHKMLKLGDQLSLADCLQLEYRLVLRCCEDHDFIEGVRALLIDKDGKPQWKPNTLEGVSPEIVDKYFSPLPPEVVEFSVDSSQ